MADWKNNGGPNTTAQVELQPHYTTTVRGTGRLFRGDEKKAEKKGGVNPQ